MYYCYALLYSNIYREKYAAFLKIDFPGIPFTSNYELFLQASKFGEELTELHLLKHKTLSHPISKYRGTGNEDRIEKIEFSDKEQRVYINSTSILKIFLQIFGTMKSVVIKFWKDI